MQALPPDGIGLTGQIHGMLYVDEKGAAVSSLCMAEVLKKA